MVKIDRDKSQHLATVIVKLMIDAGFTNSIFIMSNKDVEEQFIAVTPGTSSRACYNLLLDAIISVAQISGSNVETCLIDMRDNSKVAS